MTVKISVAIITYNRRAYLEQALVSVLAQDAYVYEVIVVDDGSTDDTSEFLRSLAYAKIKYVKHEKNLGRSASQNSAKSAFSGDFLIWLDDDDLLTPNAIASHLQVLETNPQAQIIYGNLIKCDENLNRIGELIYRSIPEVELFSYLVYQDPFPQGGTMISRSVFDAVGPYDLSKIRAQDYDYWTRAAVKGIKFCHNNEFIYLYRFHANNVLSPENARLQHRFQCDVVDYILKNVELERIFPLLAWQDGYNEAASAALTAIAKIFACNENYSRALEVLGEAEKFSPTPQVLEAKACFVEQVKAIAAKSAVAP